MSDRLDLERLARAMCEASHEDWNRYEDQKANWRYAQKVAAIYARLADPRDELAAAMALFREPHHLGFPVSGRTCTYDPETVMVSRDWYERLRAVLAP
jgi:hypothetical protein